MPQELPSLPNEAIAGSLRLPLGFVLILLCLIQAVLFFVVPVFAAMFADFGARLPSLTQFIIDFADFWKKWWWAASPPIGISVGTGYAFAPNKRRFILISGITILCLIFIILIVGLFLPVFHLGAVAENLN